MTSGDLAFAALAANPIGGLIVAIPFATFQLGYPAWLVLALGVPLAYLQVIAVDLLWSALARWPRWERLIERRRSPRIERLVASRGQFWWTMLATPLIGPWLVIAFMRYAHVPHRRVALPIFLGLFVGAVAITAVCLIVPEAWAR